MSYDRKLDEGAAFHVLPGLAEAPLSGAPVPPAQPAEALALAFSRRHRETLRRGQTLFLSGDRGEDVFRVQSGVIRFTAVLIDGRRMIAGFRLDGETFSVSARGRYLYSAEAASDCRLHRMPAAQFDALKLLEGETAGALERGQGEAWLMQAEAMALLHRDSEESLGYFVHEIGRRLVGRLRSGTRFRLEMARGDIADYLGLTVETVCRGMKRLRDDGILFLNGPHEIVVRDAAALRRRAGITAPSRVC
jgi:CRP/FNR family transcriptional regulator